MEYTLKNSEKVTVRLAEDHDFEGCLSILESVVSEKIYIMTDRVDDRKREQLRSMISENKEGGMFAVAVLRDILVGTIDFRKVSSSPRADHLKDLGMSVIKEYRSIGVGYALLDFAVKWAREHNIEKLTLGVFSTNTSARSFYTRFGFREEGINRKFAKINGDYVDLIYMGYFLEH